MSRIHEALKKAEEERAMSQPNPRVEIPPILDAPEMPVGVSAGVVHHIPSMATGFESLMARSRQVRWNPDARKMIFFGSEEHAPGMEEFRTLRSRLYQAREKQALSKLLITSALPKEGKSFTTANLGQVIVRQHGRRALLIDADLRNPQLHNHLGAEIGPGLGDYLRGEADEYSIVQRGPMENLFLIPAGRIASNPAELLSNGRLKALLQRLEPLFDWIIIDSPPAVPVSDAAMLANFCDGVLLVVRSNSTPVDAARRARAEFTGRNVVGVVLNGITSEQSPYMQYYYSAYPTNVRTEDKN
jgi:capsular exopolysaccharide synthesis family protein